MRAALVAIALAACSLHAGALEITHVQHEPAAFDPSKGQKAKVRFHLSEPARVRVRIFDGRNLQVREIAPARALPAADQTVTWDGKDSRGRRVPPEAYVYTIEAQNAAGELVEWDLSDHTGGNAVELKQVEWNPDKGSISYIATKLARVNVRVGIKSHGPLLRTVVDWAPRTAGGHTEAWNGKDASNVLDVSRDPDLEIAATGFSLSDNTILVLPEPRTVKLIEDLPAPRVERKLKKTVAPKMYAHQQQAADQRRDFPLTLLLPSDVKVARDGIPIIRGPVAVRLEVPKSDALRALNERFEAVFFIDKQFVFETEVGFLPLTWQWNPDGVADGIHYISANVRGYDGHFGMATIRVRFESTREE